MKYESSWTQPGEGFLKEYTKPVPASKVRAGGNLTPPYDLKDYQTAIELEELRFISISDYSYEIKNPKISIFGDAAIVAMELIQKGMLVDNKAFTGEHMKIKGRATFVLVKQPTWKIAHIHLSKIEG